MGYQDKELQAQQATAKTTFQKIEAALDKLDLSYQRKKATHTIVEIPSNDRNFRGKKRVVSVLQYSYDDTNIENTGKVLEALYNYWQKHLKDLCVMHLQIHDVAWRAKNMWGWKPSRQYEGFAIRGGRTNLVELYFNPIQDDELVPADMIDMSEEYLGDLERQMRQVMGSSPDEREVTGTNGEATVHYRFAYNLKEHHDSVHIADMLGSFDKSYGGGVSVQVDEVYVTEKNPPQIVIDVSVQVGYEANV